MLNTEEQNKIKKEHKKTSSDQPELARKICNSGNQDELARDILSNPRSI